MIYTLTFKKKNSDNLSSNKKISTKIQVLKYVQVKKVIKELYNEYFFFNKVFHPLDDIMHFYTQKKVFSRKISNVNHLVFIELKEENRTIYHIFLSSNRKGILIALLEELKEINSENSVNKSLITLYGNISVSEMSQLKEIGYHLEFPIDFIAFLIELWK